ncbi:MAG: hypothetical protein NZZ41_00625 [Candidatus Dojkabacteria bacterium]|nr:hypothetical protein [Candidatus Dojkabacteria bacterium]
MNVNTHEELFELFRKLREEELKIIDIITEICWFMRGSISWSEAWNLDVVSVKRIQKLIKENVERTNKTGLPII